MPDSKETAIQQLERNIAEIKKSMEQSKQALEAMEAALKSLATEGNRRSKIAQVDFKSC